jgi:hypothetical protein
MTLPLAPEGGTGGELEVNSYGLYVLPLYRLSVIGYERAFHPVRHRRTPLQRRGIVVGYRL